MDRYLSIPIGELSPSPTNPRKTFEEAALQELAQDLRVRGLVQPIVVRPQESGYEIVCGERRYRAAKLAELAEVPCRVVDLSDADVLEWQVVENSSRQDVHPLEEMGAFAVILESGLYGSGTEAVKKLAAKVGKSTRYVYDRLSLRNLGEDASKEFLAGKLTYSHCVELCRVTPREQAKVLKELGAYGDFSVRRLRDRLQQKVQPLHNAPFPLSDETLLKQVPACGLCPKNTSVDRLKFADWDKLRCTDPGCYKRKVAAFEVRRIEDVRTGTGEQPRLISINHFGCARKDVLAAKEYELVDRSAAGAVPAIVVDLGWHNPEGIKLYEQRWIRLVDKGALQETAQQQYDRERAERQKAAAIDDRYRRLLAEHVYAKAGTVLDVDAIRELIYAAWIAQEERIGILLEIVGWSSDDDEDGVDDDRLRELIMGCPREQLPKLVALTSVAREVERSWRQEPVTRLEAAAAKAGADLAAMKAEAEGREKPQVLVTGIGKTPEQTAEFVQQAAGGGRAEVLA